MHPRFSRASDLSREVIGAAIRVHRVLGPGLMESIYERCLVHELNQRGLRCAQQSTVTVRYGELRFDETLRCDLLVEDCLLVELKAVQQMLPIHRAQVLTYLRLLEVPLGLLINFHEIRLVEGLERLVLPGAGRK